MLPEFFCVGAQKAGTTTLHDILRQHPDIFLPAQKETKFFVKDELYRKGVDFYLTHHFRGAKAGQVLGEIDPDYMYFDYVAQRLFDSFGADLKLIFILRDPVERAYSHYWMSVRRGHETLSFEQALVEEPSRLENGGEFARFHFSYLDRGRYSVQIRNFLKYFPKEQMHVELFEDLVSQPGQTVKRILEFLAVDSDVTLNVEIQSNRRSQPRSLLLRDCVYTQSVLKKIGRVLLPVKSLRRQIIREVDRLNQKPVQSASYPQELKIFLLNKFFLDEIKELEILTGIDLSHWKDRSD